MIEFNEDKNKAADLLLGTPKPETSEVFKIQGDAVTKTLGFVHTAIVQFLNKANQNVFYFFKLVSNKHKETDQEIAKLLNIVKVTRKSYDSIKEQIIKLEYRIRNQQFQRPQTVEHRPIKHHELGLLALIAGALAAYFGPDLVKKLLTGQAELPAELPATEEETPQPQDEEQPDVEKVIELPEVEVTEEKPKPVTPIIPDSDIKLHKSIIELHGDFISMEAFQNLEMNARKIEFSAEEIIIESDDITLTSEPIIDKQEAEPQTFEQGVETAKQIETTPPPQPSVPGPAPILPGWTPPEQKRIETWDDATEAAKPQSPDTGPPPNPEPKMPDTIPEIPQVTGWPPTDANSPMPFEDAADDKITHRWRPDIGFADQLSGEASTNIIDERPRGPGTEFPNDKPIVPTPTDQQMMGAINPYSKLAPHMGLPSTLGKANEPQIQEERQLGEIQPEGELSKGAGIGDIKGPATSQVSKSPVFFSQQQKPEPQFRIQTSGMAAWASDNTGVFKPGMMVNYAQKAASAMVEKMPKEKFDKLPADVKAHVQAALEGRGNFDANFIARRTAPTMTRAELEQTKKEMREGGIDLIEPEGWKTPDERPKPEEKKPEEKKPTTESKQPEGQTPEQAPAAGPQSSQPTPVETAPDTSKIEPSGPTSSGGTPAQTPPQPKPETQDQTQEEPQGPQIQPTQSDPEREPGRPASGSYGGMKSSRDNNSGICVI